MEYYDVDKLNSDLSCPRDIKGLDVDLCQDYQMQGNAEFVPRLLEEELTERWILQCRICENMNSVDSDPFAQPEMNLN
ncbi:MAG: hypothetical protein PHE63_03395 [Eubacteriales bacterium]|jgi:hypothetical protein|nr:hypothetical protein [Eubacteriales bacterium]MDD3197910.1 hypothetical protein [Eubacteriales bacterium]MDD3503110.1 hypothetical protein [Eubacteriales bacterium]